MDLDETNNELEATKQTLYDTETQLTERKIILHDHIKAEAEFQKAAEQGTLYQLLFRIAWNILIILVTATLAASLKDIKGLHQRIGTKRNSYSQ